MDDNAARIARVDDIAVCYPKIVCAWGAHGGAASGPAADILRSAGAALVCLGKTKGGHPGHPLYVPGNQPLEPFDHQPEPF